MIVLIEVGFMYCLRCKDSVFKC